ncbi:MAG: sensor histidine kinase [Spirochaetia bacterium]
MAGDLAARAHRDSPLVYTLYLLAYTSVLIRMLLSGPVNGTIMPPAYILMAGFLALSIAYLPLSRRWPLAAHVTLTLQSFIAFAVLLTKPPADYYCILFMALSVVAGRDMSSRQSIAWLAVFCAGAAAGLFAAFGTGALNYLPLYIAGCLTLGLYGRATRNAEIAWARSEELRAELEAGNRRLRQYAERAEEAAASQERTFLARELHDAATQTVFSINLTAEAARLALRDEPEKASALMANLQELAREALAEMRTLVGELRPGSVVDEGLVRSLERLVVLRRKRDGMTVTITVKGDEEGGTGAKETIFRTAREALNNIARHAGVKDSRLDLTFTPREIALLVRDSGRGFDPAGAHRPESFGLVAMRERLDAQGGSLFVRSAPGAGTEIEARIPLD